MGTIPATKVISKNKVVKIILFPFSFFLFPFSIFLSPLPYFQLLFVWRNYFYWGLKTLQTAYFSFFYPSAVLQKAYFCTQKGAKSDKNP